MTQNPLFKIQKLIEIFRYLDLSVDADSGELITQAATSRTRIYELGLLCAGVQECGEKGWNERSI